jgi:hypothetical protein
MSSDKDRTSGKYNKSNYSNREERKQLFSEVLELDYMKGPTRTFNMNDKLWIMRNSPLVDMVLESTGNISSERMLASVRSSCISNLDDFLVIAEFYSELKSKMPKKPATERGIVFNSFESLKSYFKKNEDPLASYFNSDMQPCLVRQDKRNRKYIQLTEAGENALKAIWSNVERSNFREEIPFSKLEDMKKELLIENNGKGVLVNVEKKPPSILVQNTVGSAGLTADYAVPDGLVIEYSNSIKIKD